MTVPLQKVLDNLPNLSRSDLEQVKVRVDFLIGVGARPVEDVDWLTEGMVTVLIGKGLMLRGLNWKVVAPRNYIQDCAAVRALILDAVRRPCSLTEKYVLGRLVATALFDYLHNGFPGLGLKGMLQNVTKIPQALDASYPGYLKAGMLGALLRNK